MSNHMQTLESNHEVLAAVATPDVLEETDLEEELGIVFATENPYNVLVLDDSVNTMDYVALVFVKYFGYSTEKAVQLMMRVHEEGRAVVWTGSKDEAEEHVQAMHRFGLQSKYEQAG